MAMIQPRLPPELERDIFELAARIHPEVAAPLTTVARRVQIWIEKIIYHTISLSTRTQCTLFLRTLSSTTRPPTFFHTHIKAICLPYFLDTTQASLILERCSGVENLGCWAKRGFGGPLIRLPSGDEHCSELSSGGGTTGRKGLVRRNTHTGVGLGAGAMGTAVPMMTLEEEATGSVNKAKGTALTLTPPPPSRSQSLWLSSRPCVSDRVTDVEGLSEEPASYEEEAVPSSLPLPQPQSTTTMAAAGPRPRRLSIALRDVFPLAAVPSATHIQPANPFLNNNTSFTLHTPAPEQQQHQQQPDFTHPLFNNITHLRINDPWTSWTEWCHHLVEIKQLTHLAVDISGMGLTALAPAGTETRLERIRRILVNDVVRRCPKLRVCVVYVGRQDVKEVEKVFGEERIGDLEFEFSSSDEGVVKPKDKVVILPYANPLENWEADVRGKEEMCHWRVGERVLERREQGWVGGVRELGSSTSCRVGEDKLGSVGVKMVQGRVRTRSV